MDSRRIWLSIAAQVGVFALGVGLWLAFSKGYYATAVVCGLGAVGLAVAGVNSPAFHLARERLRSRLGPAPIFTAELGRRRLQMLLDQAPSPLLLQTDDDQLIAVNRAARQLFGVAYALPLAVRRNLLGEGDLFAPGRQIVWEGRTFAVQHNELIEDNRTSQLAVLTDISADVRAAEATALRDLLRVLNHELMNALTPVASMSKSALDLLHDDTPEARHLAVKALERVVARTEGLHDFINAYRALTRLPPPSVQTVRLSEWLDVLHESFTAQWSDKGGTDKGVTLLWEVPPEDMHIRMDEDQMWLCAGNLLNNGAQAALEKGEARVRLRVTANEAAISVLIEDSGPGIPTEHSRQVFMPFFTTKATGTGVGLSLARQIVQGHGSELSLLPVTPGDPDALGGARFAFTLTRV
ncbi:PAS domain-containing sensor histidine kinase [Asticcacaulis sp. AND118]|uniref:sensor histidine kinase n=1 Tax=Asticcacaulis sp. AND118 TaxID=2840468 RepID=UPI001D000950|nr:HAMP domain-containing sensor histidine kinase [Asticcacaulis sp. AND118]UDF05545.1 HAMP domain-containing histidine kinase [Asticcacaulis sp. AND118]